MGENFVFILFLLVPLALGVALARFGRVQRARSQPASWKQLIVGNALLFSLLASLLFLGGEVYFRFLYDSTDSLDYSMVSKRWYRRYYIENSAGLRDNIEYSRQIEPGKRRITFVGDSFTAGHGIKSVEDRFANRIRAAHPGWEIHLLARPGLDTDAQMKLLHESVNGGYQLDQVVLVYCLNDVADLFPDWGRSVEEFFADTRNEGWFRRNSYLVNTLFHRYKVAHNPRMKDYYEFVREGYQGVIWQKQQQRLAIFQQWIQARNGRLLVVTFPFLHSIGPGYRFQFAHQELDRFWSGLKVPHLDLLPVYSNLLPEKLTVNRYDAHPNEEANRLAAIAIEEFLKAHINPASSPASPAAAP